MMEDMYGLTIDGVHTGTLGLCMESMKIPMPEPRVNRVKVPGMSGTLDFTEAATGEVVYEDREGVEFVFGLLCDYREWYSIYTKVSMLIHGKKVKITVDDDQAYYYICRLKVDGQKSDEAGGKLVLSGMAEPFKYEQCASDEDWMWDTFSFETGVIRELKELQISGSRTVTVAGGGMPQPIEVSVNESSGMTMKWNGRTFTLQNGRYRFPMIRVGQKDEQLEFSGNGEITIHYRGAWL